MAGTDGGLEMYEIRDERGYLIASFMSLALAAEYVEIKGKVREWTIITVQTVGSGAKV